MLNRNIFIGIILCCALIISGFFVFIYNPKEEEQENIKQALLDTENKFNAAKRAVNDLNKIKLTLAEQQENLNSVKRRFIRNEELSSITVKIRNFTRSNNLKLVDFTPLFKNYFADTSTAEVKALPFSITVEGRFLDIGRFVEGWENLDFYMVPDEITARTSLSRSNLLEATVTGNLYAWAND